MASQAELYDQASTLADPLLDADPGLALEGRVVHVVGHEHAEEVEEVPAVAGLLHLRAARDASWPNSKEVRE